ncbi:MAG: glycine--tRNA ligase subunit beta, partial [Nitrospirae bacterium]|nr:glycine--tRNA ligase subunit beta [Nitrospirota bacterium]
TEEIPARFFPLLLGRMRQEAARLLESEGLSFRDIEVYGTPRRFIFRVRDLIPRQADRTQEILGPPRKAAFDPQGNPTAAALGFAKSQGVAVNSLEVKTTEKGEYLCVTRREVGRETREVLPGLLVRFLSQISFPKAMRWNATQTRFARPVRWILCLYGKENIPFAFAGIQSGVLSWGHPFLSPESYVIGDVSEYERASESHFVVYDPEKRRESIASQLDRELPTRGGALVPDGPLLEEVVFLVEYPVAVCGSFDPAFLELPREVLITSMRGHQKCFSMERDGALLPYFIGISNIQTSPMDGIRKGYERVLRARLTDARFFFENDRKVSLEARVERLRQVIFLEKLGTLHDKAQRLRPLARRVCAAMGWDSAVADAERAALLCKADLLTEMVGEFPELQGIMGREYARREGEPGAVAEAIFEHYLPRNAGDIFPATPAGAALALAEKIDNLVGCFSIDRVPSGSHDPYALRRQTLGILNILIQRKRRGSLTALLSAGIEAYGDRIPPEGREGLLARLLQFIRDRAEGLWQAEEYPYDTIRTVLAGGLDDPSGRGERNSGEPSPGTRGERAFPGGERCGGGGPAGRGRGAVRGSPEGPCLSQGARGCVLRSGPGDGSRPGRPGEPVPAPSSDPGSLLPLRRFFSNHGGRKKVNALYLDTRCHREYADRGNP